jgi:carbamoyl-phosphate synthase large subunit
MCYLLLIYSANRDRTNFLDRRRDVLLVTGVGGGIGQSILKSLAGTRYSCIGMDADSLAAGLYATAVAYQGARSSEPAQLDRLLAVCKTEGCSLLYPGVESELPLLAANMERFVISGVQPVVSSPEVIDICDDKLETATFLQSHGFRAPATSSIASLPHCEFPLVLKPQKGGAGSQTTFVVRNRKELDSALQQVDPANCVAQEYVEGDEFTCGTVNLGGCCRGVIVMRRTLRAGDTYKAFVVRDATIENYVRDVADALQPFGACNFQLRVRDGAPYIFDINARCSGTTHARSLAGFNEPLMISDYLLHGIEPTFDIREIVILRYWRELVVQPDTIASLVSRGRVENIDTML